MKAIQIEKERQMAVVDIPAQEMKSNEVLLRLEYVGFCGSDLSTYLGKNPMVRMPVIPGHEVGAVIEKVGADVPEGLKPGMTVTVNPYTNCGKCASCRNNRVNACQHNETLGVQRNGAMRELITLPWEKIIPAGELRLPCREPCPGDRYRHGGGHRLWYGGHGCHRTQCAARCYGGGGGYRRREAGLGP